MNHFMQWINENEHTTKNQKVIIRNVSGSNYLHWDVNNDKNKQCYEC